MDLQTPIALFLVALAAAAFLSRQARAMGLWHRPTAKADGPAAAKGLGCQGCSRSASCSKPSC